MKSTFYARYARLILAITICIVPLVLTGAMRALQSNTNDVRQWLPRGFLEAREYDWFLEHFGSEEMVVVSWPGGTVDDERFDRLAEGLAPFTRADGTASTDKSAEAPHLFRSVLTARQLLSELTSPPLNLSEEEALRRLEGSLVGPDQRSSALVAMISQEGALNRSQALETINRVAQTEAGLDSSELRMGGPTVDSVALDVESERARYLLSGISVIIALLLAWRCLKRVRLVMMVFATALLCTATSTALVYLTGGTMNLVLVMMPTLIYVLSISGAIHLANYYRDAVAKGGTTDAPRQAMAAGWRPCALAACTTAVGLGSLGVSEVVPVKMFGIYSALGLLCSLPILFLFLPALMQLWPPEPETRQKTSSSRWLPQLGAVHWSRGLTAFVTTYHRWITAFSLGLMAFLGFGLTQLNTSVNLLNFFSPDARIIRDYDWLEEHLGPLVPVEVVLHIDRDSRLLTTERMELVSAVKDRLNHVDKVGGTMSAATYAPPVPSEGGLRNVMHRRVLEEKLRENRERFVEAHYVRDVDDGELWRVSARVAAMNSLDYGRFIDLLREQVDPVLRDVSGDRAGEVRATYTGIIPLVYKAQRELLNDLITSFFTAFALIGLVMIVMLRNVPAGLGSMLPSIFPAVLIFGAMGWWGEPIGIGSMMTASLALGIAVDDTIHFLSWFRRGMRQGLSRVQSIQMSYERCAGAMLQTTIICGLGLLVFAFSDFQPTSRFAWLMSTLLVTALVGDLVFLPALLAGRWGRFFEHTPAAVGDSLASRWKQLWQGTAYEPLSAAQPVPAQHPE